MPTPASLLAGGDPVLLDGAMGTELARQGAPLELPLWTTAALLETPGMVRELHARYAAAGAGILTACTFRTHRRALLAAGHPPERAVTLTRRAVDLAREGAAGRALVAGSQAPLEDCYEPARVPEAEALEREHRWQATALAAAGVDLILVETMGTGREAVAATRAAVATGLPVVTSLLCTPEGRLWGGEGVTRVAETLVPLGPVALAINCTAATTLHGPLEELLRASGGLPVGAYGNIGYPDPARGWITTEAASPDAYARLAAHWLALGARLVGGCCGTTPEHIAQLRRMLRDG